MPRLSAIAVCFVLLSLVSSVNASDKKAMIAAVESRVPQSWEAALKIWEWAELGYQEEKSSKLLAEMLEAEGFKVERGVAEIPTAFTATFGSGQPVIGILGEYDALPGLSQAAVPYRQPREGATTGHACGHHLFGVASATAAIAVAEQIKAGHLKGTVRFYGCPAEEGGSGKVFMGRAGLFSDCDAVLHWHPGAGNSAGDRSTLARIAVKFRFRGQAAHAAGAPEEGRSALDAVELTNHATQLLREHTPDGTRIHHVITAGGDAPNIVPEYAEVYYYVRHPKSLVVRDLYRRLVLCAEGAALATETKLETVHEGGIVEILPNSTLTQISLANLRALNDLEYTPEELEFALRIRETLPKPAPLDQLSRVDDRSGAIGNGSTDVGDVSWLVPTTGFGTACWVPGTPAHSWQAVAAGGTSIGRKGMVLATKVLAANAWDLMTQPDVLAQAKAEHARKVGQQKYEPLMGPGQQPPFDYRKPSRGR